MALAVSLLKRDMPVGQLLVAVGFIVASTATARASSPVLPQGGQFVGGAGSMTLGGSALTINQTSPRGIIDWKSFSIGQGGAVNFNNGLGATLNRVTGGDLSQILGTLKATGSVYLVNPNGVVVGSSGAVITNGTFLASTANISNGNFMNGGSLLFQGSSSKSVANAGSITSLSGDVVLIGTNVVNSGSIAAQSGDVALAAGQTVLLADGAVQNGNILVELGGGDVTNKGTIGAAQAELKAAGGNIYALAGNDGGVIRATGTTTVAGHVWLATSGTGSVTVSSNVSAQNRDGSGGVLTVTGGANGGAMISGDLDVSGTKGGAIIASAGAASLGSSAILTASGTSSGGTILVGGDKQGGANAATKLAAQLVATSKTTTVVAGATLLANGGTDKGGNIVVWSDGATRFAGTASARGLVGGYVETSGHTLAIDGGKVDAGLGGTWLLDPDDLTIDATLADTIDATLGGGTNVVEQTGASGSGGSGNITVASNIGWSSSASLTLSAYKNIVFDSGVTISNGTPSTVSDGGLVLRADNTGTGTGSVIFHGTGVDFSNSTGAVSLYYNPLDGASNSTINTKRYTSTIGYSGGTAGYTSEVSLGSHGATLVASMLVNTIDDLQNIENNLRGDYALGTNIDASASSSFNGGTGFMPIGFSQGSARSFTGTFDGMGSTISNLTINRAGTAYVGLFAQVHSGGAVENLTLSNAQITGGRYVGAIAGFSGGTLGNITLTGNSVVDARQATGASRFVGGLVGYNTGAISSVTVDAGSVVGSIQSDEELVGGIAGDSGDASSGATPRISGATFGGTVYGDKYVGGITGGNYGYVTNAVMLNTSLVEGTLVTGGVNTSINVGGVVGVNSTAAWVIDSTNSGKVTGGTGVGGLVAENDGVILTSTSSGPTSGVEAVGGVLGVNNGTVTQSVNSGTVNGTTYVGGIVGQNDHGAVQVSSNSGTVTGTIYVGGAVGINQTGNTVFASYSNGAVSGTSRVGGLVGYNESGAQITETYSTGAVTGTARSAGGLIGYNNGYVFSSYYDTDTDPIGTAIGTEGSAATGSAVEAASTATMSSTGFIFDAGWNPVAWANNTGSSTPVFNSVSLASTAPAFVVATINGLDKTYDTTTSDGAAGSSRYYFDGLRGSEQDLAIEGTSTAVYSFRNKNAGTVKIVTETGLSLGGADASKHPFIVLNGRADITPAPLVATVAGVEKVYDTTTNDPGASISITPVGSDNVTGAATSYSFDNKNVGNGKVVTASGVSFGGTDVGNYTITLQNGTADITPAALVATITGVNKVYDTGVNDPGASISITPLGSDDVTASATSYSFDTKNVGNGKTVTASGVAFGGADMGNYTITLQNGTANISPASLLVTANSAAITYGTTPTLGVTYSGFVLGESAATALSGTAAVAGAGTNAGTYTLTPSGLTALNGNYTITYAPGTLIINPAALTIAANSVSVQQGTTPTFSASYSGFVNQETPAVLNGALTFGGSAIGATSPGTYSLVPGGYSSPNYLITYLPGTLNITPFVLPTENINLASNLLGIGYTIFPTLLNGTVQADGLSTVFSPTTVVRTRFSVVGLNGT